MAGAKRACWQWQAAYLSSGLRMGQRRPKGRRIRLLMTWPPDDTRKTDACDSKLLPIVVGDVACRVWEEEMVKKARARPLSGPCEADRIYFCFSIQFFPLLLLSRSQSHVFVCLL
jgi:hypothetical protein